MPGRLGVFTFLSTTFVILSEAEESSHLRPAGGFLDSASPPSE